VRSYPLDEASEVMVAAIRHVAGLHGATRAVGHYEIDDRELRRQPSVPDEPSGPSPRLLSAVTANASQPTSASGGASLRRYCLLLRLSIWRWSSEDGNQLNFKKKCVASVVMCMP